MSKIKFIRESEEKKENPERIELAAGSTGKVMLAEESKRTVLFEDISRREPNAKHFRMSDGTFKAVYYPSPVHYYDEEDGKYIVADSASGFCAADAADEEDFDGYENRGVNFKTKLAQHTDGCNLMVIQKGPYKLIWKLLGRKDKVSGKTAMNHAAAVLKAQDIPEKSGSRSVARNLQGEIRYDHFADGCDLQYIILPHKVKENIIINQKGDSYRFEFMLKTKNLDLELAENGQSLLAFAKQGESRSAEQQAKREQGKRRFSAQQTEEAFSLEQGGKGLSEKKGETELSAEAKGVPEKEIIFRIPMPYMYDAKGGIGEDVSYDLEQKDGETYCFAVEADANWINAEDRVLPVTIDPAIDVDEFAPIFISNSAFNKTASLHTSSNYRYVGGGTAAILPTGSGVYAKTYFKITLPQSLSNCKINHIGLKLNVINHIKDTAGASKFFLRECSAVDMSEPPFYASEGEIIDYIRQGEVESDQYLEFDLTKLYKNGSTTAPRYVCLSGYDGSSGENDLLILSCEALYGHEGILEIDYTLNRTLRSEEFQTNDVKRAGTHLVDLFTGSNKFVHRDHEFTEGKRLALEISHVFNSWEKSHDYYTVSKGGYQTAVLGMGRGWKLNVHQFAFKVEESASAYDNSLKYLYIDQNGDEISFVRSVTRRAVYSGNEVAEIQEKEEFLDEQGKKLKCYEEDGEIRIADDDGTVLSFLDNELCQITDKNGDYIKIVKDACYGRISRVYDSLGNYAVFSYDASCRLNQITFSDGKELTYSYDATGRLIKIAYPDAGATEFYYGESGGLYDLSSIRDRSGYRLNVRYENNKVSELKDFACNRSLSVNGVTAYTSEDAGVNPFSAQGGTVYEKPGNPILIRYQNGLTSVVTKNGYAQNYQFNQTGFCECVYETKDELSASEMKKTVTGISYYKSFDLFDTYEIRPSAVAHNFLDNGSFECFSNCLDWVETDGDIENGQYGVSVDGDRALAICGSLTDRGMIRQRVYGTDLALGPGEGLVLSGYGRADSLPFSEDTKFRLFAELFYADGSVVTESVDFDYTKTGWQFVAKGIAIDQSTSLNYADIYVEYSFNNGRAYFDKIQLCKGDAVYTRGKPRFFTLKDSKTFDISELEKILYKDTDHIFNINSDETLDVKKAKMTYLNIVAMQNNPGVILDENGVIDTNVDDKKTFLVFRRNGMEYKYSLFDIEYAASGITEILNKSGTVRLFKRKDDQIERIETEDRDGNLFFSTFEYDGNNRLKKETDFRGVVKEYTYTSEKYENLASERVRYGTDQENDIVQKYAYENNRYLSRVYDERQIRGSKELFTRMNYASDKDRLQSITLPNGQSISYQYDENNTYLLGISTTVMSLCPVNGAVHSNNVGVSYSYQLGYLTEIKANFGVTYRYEYDGFGNLTKTRLNGVEVLSVARYDESDYSSEAENTFNYEEITLANGWKIREIYNRKGNFLCRKIREQIGVLNGEAQYGGETESYRVFYREDANGELLDEIDYTVDKTPAIDAGTPTATSKWLYHDYAYRENGELLSISRRGYRSGTDRVDRDEGGRARSEIHGFARTSVDQSYRYEYDQHAAGGVIPDDRLKKVRMFSDAGEEQELDAFEFQYDEIGRIKSRKLSVSGAETFRESYGYAARKSLDVCNNACDVGSTNYISTIQHKCGSESYTEFVDYDAMGNLSQVQVGSQSVTYAYDTADRLIREENGPMGVDHHYEYDSSGNLTAVYTKTHGSTAWQSREIYTYRTEEGQPTNQLLSVTKSNLSGGSASSIFTAEEYDGVGNPCKYRGNVLQWKRGRMLTGYGGNAYRYDGDGIRQEKITAAGAVHRYYTSGGKILGEEIVANGSTNTYRYLYVGDQVVGLVKNNSQKYYFQYNATGDVSKICDATGEIAASYVYDAWGNHRIYDGSGVEVTYDLTVGETTHSFAGHIGRINPFRYKGYYYDAETGLYYLQSRYYDPKIRRFVNADNIGIVSSDYLTTLGGQNLYSYCLNNPVNHEDPTGHSITAVLGVIWAVTKLAVSLAMLGLAVYGLVGAIQSFWKEPNWLNLLFVVIAVVGVVASVAQVVRAVKDLAAAVNRLARGYITTIDGVDIYKAQRKDFTDEAWDEIQSLKHRKNGETISSTASGKKIHKGFKVDADGNTSGISLPGAGRTTGKYGFTDAYDAATRTIFELKPNNAKSISAGIKQLKRYANAFKAEKGIAPKLILVVY